MSFRKKMVLILLAIGLLPMVAVAGMELWYSGSLMREQAEARLMAVRSIKSTQIDAFFRERASDITLLTQSQDIEDSFEIFQGYHDSTGASADGDLAVESEEYTRLWQEWSGYLASYIATYGYYDAFIICAEHGHVLFTVAREADLGTNLSTGTYRDSGLARVWRQALDTGEVAWSDFSPYAPSNGEAAMFVARPFTDDTGRVMGIVALQISLDAIDAIMQAREGLGVTEETYLVGPDLRMRSNSFLDPQGHSVQASFAGTVDDNGADTEAVRRALEGEQGVGLIIDYNGNPVLSAFAPLDVGGMTWAILAEIDKAEVMEPIRRLETGLLLVVAVVAALIVICAVFMGNGVVRPVNLISHGAKLFARGDINLTGLDLSGLERIRRRKDEIGDIGRAFDQLSDYMREIGSSSEVISHGDLSIEHVPKSANDTLGNAFERMVDQLNEFMGGVTDAAIQVEVGAEQIAQASQSLSQGAQEQAASLEEIHSSMQELGAQTSANAKTASDSNAVATELQHAASLGAQRMGNMVLAMSEIQDSSQSISRIIKTIDEIAFQTNLLALNAAVEAAREDSTARALRWWPKRCEISRPDPARRPRRQRS